MDQKQRDAMIELLAFRVEINDWLKDKAIFTDKDRKKLKCISDTILMLLKQYAQREGEVAFKAFAKEVKKFKVMIMPIDDKRQVDGSFEITTLRTAINIILDETNACGCCDRKDFKDCPYFTLKKFMNSPTEEKHKGQCPYKFDIGDYEL